MSESILVFVKGEVMKLRRDKIDEFRRLYGAVWQKDVLNWILADLLRRGYIIMTDVRGKNMTHEALQAIENTLSILEIRWEDVEKVVHKRNA